MSACFQTAQPPAPGEDNYIAYEKKAVVMLGKISAASEKYIRLHNGEKIPRHRVWIEKAPPPSATLEKKVAAAAQQLPPQQLWQTANGRALTLTELSTASGGQGNIIHRLAVLRQVLAHPIYFRRHNGLISAVAADIVEKALARTAKQQEEQQTEAALLQQLQNGALPPAIQQQWQTILYTPDKNTPPYRALNKFLGTSRPAAIARFFMQHGLLGDTLDYLEQQFISSWQPPAAAPSGDALPTSPALSPVTAETISIDDTGTREIDDAFSVTENPDATLTVGIHIAAAALLLTPNTAAAHEARQRLTSVYFPHRKYFMLPPDAVTATSLTVGEWRPAVSLYLTIDPAAGRWQLDRTAVNQLRLTHAVTPEAADSGVLTPDAAALLTPLKVAAEVLAADFSNTGDTRPGYKIDPAAGRVSRRPRTGITRVVEILMRCANATWAAQLAHSDSSNGGGLFRDNGGLKTQPGKIPYMWLTSPLRRYIDLANQRLLLAHLSCAAPPREEWRRLLLQFNRRYALAQQAQRMMETYWALQILAQQPPTVLSGSYLGRKQQVRLHDYPLHGTLTAEPDLPTDSPVTVTVNSIDLLEQRLSLTLCASD